MCLNLRSPGRRRSFLPAYYATTTTTYAVGARTRDHDTYALSADRAGNTAALFCIDLHNGQNGRDSANGGGLFALSKWFLYYIFEATRALLLSS